MKIEGEIHSCVEDLDIYMGEEESRLRYCQKENDTNILDECIVAIAMYAIAWPFACSRNGESWRETEKDITDGGQLSRLLSGKVSAIANGEYIVGRGPNIFERETQQQLDF